MKRVLIIDALNMFFRSYAINPSLALSGNPIGGCMGFLKSFQKSIRLTNPDEVIVVWDGAGGSAKKRHINKEYKMGRRVVHMPKDMHGKLEGQEELENKIWQQSRLFEYLENFPIHQFVFDSVEADDVIGYLTNTTLKDSKCTIMSTDKDFLQLVSDRVELYSPTKKITYDEELVKKEFGVYPKNILTCRTVEGDKSDRISGVKGVGTKSMVKEFPMLTENEKFDVKMLIDSAGSKTTRISKMIKDDELVVKRNYILMQLQDPDIPNHTKLKITDTVRDNKPQITKYKLQRLMVEDKLWGHIPNFDNWITEFMLLQHYWNNK